MGSEEEVAEQEAKENEESFNRKHLANSTFGHKSGIVFAP